MVRDLYSIRPLLLMRRDGQCPTTYCPQICPSSLACQTVCVGVTKKQWSLLHSVTTAEMLAKSIRLLRAFHGTIIHILLYIQREVKD